MFPKHKILSGPTPFERADVLSKHLEIDLHIKRDDLAGPSFGGNKARQLEYYFGEALSQNAETILITGAVQSNFTRIAVAVARSLGMEAVVQFEKRVYLLQELWQCSLIEAHGHGNRILSERRG